MTTSSPLLQQLLSLFTSKEFHDEFVGFGFLIAFLVKDTTVFVSRHKSGISDNISFDRLIINEKQIPSEYFFSSTDLPNALKDAFSIIQVMVMDLKATDQSFLTLFSELSSNQTFSNSIPFSIDHLFIFYSSSLPNNFDIRLNFSVHCIKICEKTIKLCQPENQSDGIIKEPTPDPLIISFQNGWEHCLLSNFDQKILFDYMKNITRQMISNTVTITVQLSPELEIGWVSGTKIISPYDVNFVKKTSENKNRNKMSVMISHYPTDFILRLTFQPSLKYKYEKSKLISFQAVFEFSNGDCFVSNRIWRKAQSESNGKNAVKVSNEWVDSINFAPFCMMNLHQQVSLFIFQYINNFLTRFQHRKSLNSLEIDNENSNTEKPPPRTTTHRSNSTRFALVTKLLSERLAMNGKLFTFNWSINGQVFANEMNNRDLWESDILGKCGGSKITVPTLFISQKIIELYQTLFIDKNSALPELVKLVIIFSTMTKGFGYFSALFNALFRALNDTTYFFFPPFVITKFHQEVQLTRDMTNDINIAFLPSIIHIEIEDEAFQQVADAIQQIKEKYPF